MSVGQASEDDKHELRREDPCGHGGDMGQSPPSSRR